MGRRRRRRKARPDPQLPPPPPEETISEAIERWELERLAHQRWLAERKQKQQEEEGASDGVSLADLLEDMDL